MRTSASLSAKTNAGRPGRDAVHLAAATPDGFEPHPKRCVDDRTVLLAGREIPVEAMFVAVLSRVIEHAARFGDGPLAAVTVTHPAGWGATRKEALARAAPAGTRLVAEPVAAAHFFVDVAGHRDSRRRDGAGVRPRRRYVRRIDRAAGRARVSMWSRRPDCRTRAPGHRRRDRRASAVRRVGAWGTWKQQTGQIIGYVDTQPLQYVGANGAVRTFRADGTSLIDYSSSARMHVTHLGVRWELEPAARSRRVTSPTARPCAGATCTPTARQRCTETGG
jgi:hypothetical protein